MRKIFVITFLLSCSSLWGQTEIKMYSWEEVKAASPDTVFAISFEKMKLNNLPSELSEFVHIKQLNLAKNRLRDLPSFFYEFADLEELNVEKNNLMSFPVGLCRLSNIKRLILNRNNISLIPECIGHISGLEYLDLYDNPIEQLPESLTQLTLLQEIDFSGIQFSDAFRQKWMKLLPNVKLVFDISCNCMN